MTHEITTRWDFFFTLFPHIIIINYWNIIDVSCHKNINISIMFDVRRGFSVHIFNAKKGKCHLRTAFFFTQIAELFVHNIFLEFNFFHMNNGNLIEEFFHMKNWNWREKKWKQTIFEEDFFFKYRFPYIFKMSISLQKLRCFNFSKNNLIEAN